jgi:hypothetical protein
MQNCIHRPEQPRSTQARSIVLRPLALLPAIGQRSFDCFKPCEAFSAVDPWGSTLAVDADTKGNLQMWGLIDQSVHFSAFLVKEVSKGPEMPGMFQAVIEGIGEISAYKSNVLLGTLKQATLLINQHRVFLKGPIHSKMLPWVNSYKQTVAAVVGVSVINSYWAPKLEDIWFSAVSRLLIGIQRYRHGGAVLISDEANDLRPKYSIEYRRLGEAIVHLAAEDIRKATPVVPENYGSYVDRAFPPPVTQMIPAPRQELEHNINEVKGCLRFLTSLSRVDGLLWFDSALSLRGFGVEIIAGKDPAQVYFAKNSDATKSEALVPDHFGMRHRSMMRYCGSHGSAVGFVVSEDGDVRAITQVDSAVMLWDPIRLQAVRTPSAEAIEGTTRNRQIQYCPVQKTYP